MTTQICDAFKVQTFRPENAPDVVSIAELAVFTEFELYAGPRSNSTPCSRADFAIRKHWKFEIEESDLNYLDFAKMHINFRDGSSLTLTDNMPKR